MIVVWSLPVGNGCLSMAGSRVSSYGACATCDTRFCRPFDAAATRLWNSRPSVPAFGMPEHTNEETSVWILHAFDRAVEGPGRRREPTRTT